MDSGIDPAVGEGEAQLKREGGVGRNENTISREVTRSAQKGSASIRRKKESGWKNTRNRIIRGDYEGRKKKR